MESIYIKIRDREQRVYSDEAVKQLPLGIPKDHVHYKEWQIRQLSFQKLMRIIRNLNVVRILDLGCGNGWMSQRLNEQGLEVVGLDINDMELEQAKRMFKKDKLTFVYGNIFDNLEIGKFDMIVVSAALQYFEDAPKLVERLFDYLNLDGVIIVMDTFIYKKNEVEQAKQRSINYFNEMNVPEMRKYYFHHSKEIFDPFQSRLMYAPSILDKILGKLGHTYNPFPIYKIHK